MIATIWTQKGCPLCEQVKNSIGEGNYEERAVSELMAGVDKNTDAMAQLMIQNMELPLVMIDDEFISPRELLAASKNAA
jgi:glutaredoxin